MASPDTIILLIVGGHATIGDKTPVPPPLAYAPEGPDCWRYTHVTTSLLLPMGAENPSYATGQFSRQSATSGEQMFLFPSLGSRSGTFVN